MLDVCAGAKALKCISPFCEETEERILQQLGFAQTLTTFCCTHNMLCKVVMLTSDSLKKKSTLCFIFLLQHANALFDSFQNEFSDLVTKVKGRQHSCSTSPLIYVRISSKIILALHALMVSALFICFYNEIGYGRKAQQF